MSGQGRLRRGDGAAGARGQGETAHTRQVSITWIQGNDWGGGGGDLSNLMIFYYIFFFRIDVSELLKDTFSILLR